MGIEIFTVGNVVVESIKYPGGKVVGPVLGGPVAYAGIVSSTLGTKTGVVSNVGTDLLEVLTRTDFLGPLFKHGVDTGGINVKGSDSFWLENAYQTNGTKVLTPLKEASPILSDSVPEDYLSAKGIHVGPVVSGEIPVETIQALGDLDAVLSIDIQGCLGGYFAKGTTEEQLHLSKRVAGHCDIVKASYDDAKGLLEKGETVETIARMFLDWGAKVAIITLGEKGSFVMTEQIQANVPAFPLERVTEAGAIGAGDSYCAGFLVEYIRTRDAVESAMFASATASFLCEGLGMRSHFPTLTEVRAKMRKFKHQCVPRCGP